MFTEKGKRGRMTNEYAIEILEQRKCCRECVTKCTCDECKEAFDMAIIALTETHEISYKDCSNALLMMWMDKVITDGEYNKIIDRLNAKGEEE